MKNSKKKFFKIWILDQKKGVSSITFNIEQLWTYSILWFFQKITYLKLISHKNCQVVPFLHILLLPNCGISMLKYRTRANKGRGFYSKTIFSSLHNGEICQFLSLFTIQDCTKFSKNTPKVWGIKNGTHSKIGHY